MLGGETLSDSAAKSDFVIEKSKNGADTCSFQGKYLHSKYDPTSEGERFAENVQADFSPLCVFILEPALSYCSTPLKNRFPNAKIYAIRYFSFFKNYDSVWDAVFYLNSEKKTDFPLSERLFNFLGEERLFSSLFFEWNASKTVFPEKSHIAWSQIKKAILKARDVLGTRSFFSKRWLKNSLIFAFYVKKTVLLKKINIPVVIASSGSSLKTSLPYLKKKRRSFFLLAVSSSFMPLKNYGIIPDLVMSSDGGFWAKKHLDFPCGTDSPVFALEAEGSSPKKILENEDILPLTFEDGLEKDFFEALKIPFMTSEKNGTVAGTALTFALSLTTEKIFLCGQDLSPSSGFQHTQPNALENDNEKNDFRLKNKETRLTKSRFNSAASLEIYRNWFVTNSNRFAKRVFRLSDNFKYEFSLGEIKDINWKEFSDYFKKDANLDADEIFQKNDVNLPDKKKRREILLERLHKISKTQRFINEIFPMDSILIQREISETKRETLISNLGEKIEKLIGECEKII